MEQQRIRTGDIHLAVRRWPARGAASWATKPPVVLLPATGETANDWRAVASELSLDREVVAVDLRGHGDSDWPGSYSLALMAQDVRHLLAGFPAGVDLVGHSLGGLVAWLVAASAPGPVRRLVLEEVALPRPRTPSPPDRPAGPLDFDWAVVEQVRPEIDTPDPQWPARAGAVAAPTLVIGGGSASFVPQSDVAALATAVPAGHLITIEAGHDVHGTQPDAFVAAVRTFLDADPVPDDGGPP